MSVLRLLQLPESAKKIVLRILNPYDLISLSFCSKKSKSFVRNYGQKIKEFHADFRNISSIAIVFADNSQVRPVITTRRYSGNIQMDEPHYVDYAPLANFCFGFDYFLRHLYDTFNATEITRSIISCRGNRYDIDSIKKCLKDFTLRTLTIGNSLSANDYRFVLTSGIVSKKLYLDSHEYENASALRRVLAQSYDSIEIHNYFLEYFSKLENILAINSSCINITMVNLSDKSLNRFLKLWIKNSSSRLKRVKFSFSHREVMDESVVLKGINYTVNPPQQKREMWTEGELRREKHRVRGGLELTRVDGIKATLNLYGYYFLFHVWNE